MTKTSNLKKLVPTSDEYIGKVIGVFVSNKTYVALDSLAQNFNKNYSIVVDFLFYVFDTFSYDEKRNILKACPLYNEKNEAENKKKIVDSPESVSEEIQISIHPLLEERLINLILECEKLQTASDALDFLIFVSTLIEKDLLLDLIIQYSIESIQSSDFSYMDAANPQNYQMPDPFHVSSEIPDKSQF